MPNTTPDACSHTIICAPMTAIDDVRKYTKALLLPLAKKDNACERITEKARTKAKRFTPDDFLSKIAVSDPADDDRLLTLRDVAF